MATAVGSDHTGMAGTGRGVLGLVCASTVLSACTSQVMQGTAQLTVAGTATVVSAVFEDTRCGFASADVKRAVTLSGQPGQLGQAVYTVPDCTLDFGAGREVLPACAAGSATHASGKVSVTATMTVRGRLTGADDSPIVPEGREAVTIAFTARFGGLTVTVPATGASLLLARGTLTGELTPVLAIDAVTGACSVPSRHMTFRKLQYRNTTARLQTSGFSFDVPLEDSELNAQAGTNAAGTQSNVLAGFLVSSRVTYAIPTQGPPVLEPGDAGPPPMACSPTILTTTADSDCSLEHVLGVGAARLVVQLAGALASEAVTNQTCGYANTLKQLTPSAVHGEPGQRGAMTWLSLRCELGRALAPSPSDCLGSRLWQGGGALADSRLTVSGLRTRTVLVEAVTFDTPTAAVLELGPVDLTEFVVYRETPQLSAPPNKLTVHRGALSVRVRPVMGERRSTPGIFDVPTPVARLEQVTLPSASVTVETSGQSFLLQLTEVSLTAVNGAAGGARNLLSGRLKVNGKEVVLQPSPLDPAYDAPRFTQAYACTADLRAPVSDDTPL